MAFRKLGLFVFCLFLDYLHLPTAYPLSQKTPLVTDFDNQRQTVREERVTENLSLKDAIKIISVSRRGGGGHGGGGGHAAGGGGRGGHGGEGEGNGQQRGNGNKPPFLPGGAVIPLYAAGASHHSNNNHHHGSNGASPQYCDLNYLVLPILISLNIFGFLIN